MIEIPGYRIIRPLGRGGMASVYLAVQESVDREVALKVMAPALLGDPSFGERFLREARIAARLRHPNVVQLHDVGVAAGHHYMAMEYVPAGSVVVRDRPPRGLLFALRVTREIASALGYAHARGVIHRDIKPDNILLRDDGTAALTDFGIARANDNVRMTQTGSIMGTPSYMSPEQARGGELDGRSDLYSLGIVFYELLVGRVPYTAEDSLSVGIMHITAPLPKLPEDLAWLQPVLDRMLAKEPALRFQSGADLAQALAGIEQRFTPSPVPTVFDTPIERRDTVPAPAAVHEPTLGRVDSTLLDAAPRRRRDAARSGGGGLRWLALVGLLLLAGGGLWLFQAPIRAWLQPENPVDAKLFEAEQALAEGRLGGSGAAPGARELFDAVIAFDPDNQRARLGLIRLGEQWLQRAQTAVDSGDVAAARAAIDQARQLSVPVNRVEAIDAALREIANHESQLGGLLERADQARREGRLDEGEGSALAAYREVLAIDPGNALARNGIAQIIAQLVGKAGQAIDSGDHVTAQAVLDQVERIEPATPDLFSARARLAEAQKRQQDEHSAALAEADRLFKAGALTRPASANALDAYRAVLARVPDDAQAQAGLRRIGEALLGQFDSALADFRFERAGELLDAARAAGVGEGQLQSARARMEASQRRQQALDRSLLAAVDPQRLRALLDLAAQAVAAGQLFAPPGDSAYDKYKQVLSAEPGNGEAKAGLAALPENARQLFEQAMQRNSLGQARGYVEGLDSFRADDPALPAMKRRLAQSYAGYATERLQAGELSRARDALDHAQQLDPDNPDLLSLRARLDQASGG